MSKDVTDGIRTPERPRKKFRNDSSPFKGASLAKSTSVPVWEWMNASGEWIQYEILSSALLESGFCVQDSVVLPGRGDQVVDLRRFVEKTPATGKEVPVRRRLVASVAPPPFSSMRHYDGNALFVNKLPGVEDTVKTISFPDILGPVEEIEAILLSSYGTDIEWLLSHFVQGKTHITLIDHPPADQSGTLLPLGKLWPNFRVFHPEFVRKDGLFGMGTMHAKLILIKFPKCLRIVVSSANLEQYDWEKITQNIWLCDVHESDLVFEASKTTSGFGSDLSQFVSALLSGFEDSFWLDLLTQWTPHVTNCVPANVWLIPSVPGVHSSRDFGHWKLQSILDDSETCFFQMSSIGKLSESFLDEFRISLKCGDLKLIWPEHHEAMWMEGRDHLFLSQRNASTAPLLTQFRPLSSRAKILNHSKIIASDTWTYAGSHNMSMAAWGKCAQSAGSQSMLHVASFELGVLIKHSPGVSISLPFVISPVPAPLVKPWIREAFLKAVREESGLAQFLATASRDIAVVFESVEICKLFEKSDKFNVFAVTHESAVLRAFFAGPPNGMCVVILKKNSDLDGNTIITATLTEKEVPGFLSEYVSDDNEGESSHGETAIEYIVENSIALLCLDVDGTIVSDNQSSVLLASASKFFKKLHQKVPQVKLALVTNQGGVGLRHWMETNRFGDPESMPTQKDVEERIEKIRVQIEQICPNFELHVFMAFRYQSKNSNRWGPGKEGPRWTQDWRKPGPGMIRAAIKAARVSPFSLGKVLMVGDMDADEGAAKAAGVRFQRAPGFFT